LLEFRVRHTPVDVGLGRFGVVKLYTIYLRMTAALGTLSSRDVFRWLFHIR